MAKDPRVDDLSAVSYELRNIGLVCKLSDVLHVYDLLQVALSNQVQQGSSDVVNSHDVGVQSFAQILPVHPSATQEPRSRENSGYGHVHDSVRGRVHNAGVVDEVVEALAIERLLHRVSSILYTLRGCDLDWYEFNTAIGPFDQLLQVIRLLASSCKHLGDF